MIFETVICNQTGTKFKTKERIFLNGNIGDIEEFFSDDMVIIKWISPILPFHHKTMENLKNLKKFRIAS